MTYHAGFIKAARLYLDASKLIMSTQTLQDHIQDCYKELGKLLNSECSTQSRLARVRDLNDEIWGYKIEIQSIQVKAARLTKQAQYARFSFGTAPKAKSFAGTQ